MRYCLIAACLALFGILSTESRAEWGYEKPIGCCETACTGCSKVLVCCPSVEVVKEEKTCFEVECEHICVPEVSFSWKKLIPFIGGSDDCGPTLEPGCGKIIAVNTLKKEKYEVEKCVCKWEIKEQDSIGCCKP